MMRVWISNRVKVKQDKSVWEPSERPKIEEPSTGQTYSDDGGDAQIHATRLKV